MSLPQELKPDVVAEITTEVKPSGELESTLKKIFESPEFITRVVQAQARQVKRPPNASKLSNFSYYRPMFGLEAKIILDEMIEDKRDREWKYCDYPNLKASSLYMRAYQSLSFLIKEMDFPTTEHPEGHYAFHRQMLVMTKEKTGIRLSWIRDRLEGKAFKPSIVEDRDKISEWKEQIELFLADSTKDILHLKNLSLTIEQINELKATLDTIKTLMSVVGEKEIKIVKDKSMVVKGDGAAED